MKHNTIRGSQLYRIDIRRSTTVIVDSNMRGLQQPNRQLNPRFRISAPASHLSGYNHIIKVTYAPEPHGFWSYVKNINIIF